MKKLRILAITLAASLFTGLFALLAGYAGPQGAAPKVTEIPSPAKPGSGEPNLTAGSDGRVYLTWIEAAGKGHSLKFATLGKDSMWSAPQTIAQGENWFVNAADFPSLIALPDGTLAAEWLADNAPGSEAYNVSLSFSRDGGKTWSKPLVPHRDKSENQHGFASLVPAGGGVGMLWLDGRKIKDEVGDMSLMYTAIGIDGKLGPEAVLDGRACDCCQTSAAVTPDGIVAVYRDRSPQEIRDISIVRLTKTGWTPPAALSKDNWKIDGCPVNGPSISASGNNVAVAWFTAPNDAGRVNAVLSKDGGKTFGAPIRIDDGKPAGHVNVLSIAPDSALVSWVESTSKGPQVLARRIQSSGTRNASIAVSPATAARSGVPRMARTENQVVVTWTDGGNTGKVRTAVVRLD